ncbi:MAG: transporter [Alphaproteobacteria bacterium]|nr:transporter [Alphaproteobacteria bacterium]
MMFRAAQVTSAYDYSGKAGKLMPMISKRVAMAFSLIAWPCAAAANDLRDFCPDRPGLGTPPCTIDPGHAAVELGVADWTLDRQAGVRQDVFRFADVLIRYGVSGTLEVQLGWQGLGYVRARRTGGSATHRTGIGDATLAIRENLKNPDGSGLSLAVMPFLTLPTGISEIGAGDWTAGAILPISYALSNQVQLALTGEIDSAADTQGSGHHLAYSGVAGLGAALSKDLGATIEFAVQRDEETGQAATAFLSGLSLAWAVGEAMQLDGGANIGLSHNSADLELYVGVAKRF